MIVPMKKVTVLCMAQDQAPALDRLRELGVVHLAHVRPPAGEGLDQARARLDQILRVADTLVPAKTSRPSGRAAAEVFQDLAAKLEEKRALEARRETLLNEERRLAPYGAFDPAAVRRLAQAGVTVKLYQADLKARVALPDHAVRVDLNRGKDTVYFAVVGRGEFSVEATELRLPGAGLAHVRQELAEIATRLAAAEQAVRDTAGDVDALHLLARQQRDEVAFLEARAGMGAAPHLNYWSGYCPEPAVPALQAAARQHGWGLVVTDPDPDDPTPTLLRNSIWVKPIKAMLDMTGLLPGYKEVDVSAPFLYFLTIFFAMLVGDAGYGLVFLALTFIARKKLPKAPAYFFHMMYLMSGATIAWGVATGSYFGMDKARLPVPYSTWLSSDNNVMFLCFLLGAVHITIAHLWNVILQRRSTVALSHIGWTCTTWFMFFMACHLVLGYGMPQFMYYVFGVGAVLIIFFMTPVKVLKDEWFNHVMLPLNLISNFVDVVSYVRLFAVGSAGYAMASAFNTMLSPLFGSVLGGLAGAVLLFLGHALNIALACLGVLVHGVRLNTLEFSNHMGIQWSGRPYEPFARQAPPAAKP